MFGIGKKKIKYDERVSKILDSRGFKYHISEDGNFNYCLSLESGQAHWGVIMSETYALAGIEYRNVHSSAALDNSEYDATIFYHLLKENALLVTLGTSSWGIFNEDGENHVALLTAQVPVIYSDEDFMATIHRVVIDAATVRQRIS